MKFHERAYAALFFASGIFAMPRDKSRNPDISSADMPTRSIALCPEVEWRPLAPYKSTVFPDAWWFLPDADEANKDHYDATHPSLPSNIILPNPLLPTDNATLDAFYSLAVQAYEEDEIKQVRTIPLTVLFLLTSIVISLTILYRKKQDISIAMDGCVP